MKTILGMLLLIAAIGITTGTDYSEIEVSYQPPEGVGSPCALHMDNY